MFHCPFCDAMLSGDSSQASRCPQCGSQLLWTEEPLPEPPGASSAPVLDSEPGLPESRSESAVHVATAETRPEIVIPRDPSGDQNRTQGNESSTLQVKAPLAGELPDAPANVEELWRGSYSHTISPRMTLKASVVAPPIAPGLSIRSRQLRHSDEYGADEADYELLERIGQGGVGEVFAARQASVDRTVAIKMLKSDSKLDADSRQKFLSEAVVTGDLDHPNIVPIYDLGADERGALFYSMKRVRGTPWSDCLRQKTLRENLEILMKVADAIAFAHSRAVVHRDIKPENVMLGDFGEVLVMDWGIALPTAGVFKSGRISQSTSMGGTPAYMSPEMATGPIERIGTHSDVYLLGAVLYEVITGNTPHTGADVLDCLYAAARNEIQPTDQEGELLEIALRAMATDIAARYASVHDFQQAVRSYQSHSESIALAVRAEEDLVTAEASRSYADFARAVFACQEALALWPQNTRAAEALQAAQLAYAQAAYDKEDYDLGLSLLDEYNSRHQPLIRKLMEGQRDRHARQARLTFFRRAVVGMAAAIFVVVTTGLLYIRGKNQALTNTVGELNTKQLELEAKKSELEGKQIELNQTNTTLASERDELNDKKLALESTNVALDKQRRKADDNAQVARREERNAEQTSYLSRIALAAAQSQENAFLNVRDSLATYAQPQLAHWRHWEWGRLEFLSSLQQHEVLTQGRIECLAVVPQESLAVSGAASGALQLWNTENWKLVSERRFGGPIRALAVSRDGHWLAVAVSEESSERRGEIHIWKLSDWLELAPGNELPVAASVLRGHQEDVVSLVFKAEGQQLLSASLDQTARLWDFSQRGPDDVVPAVAFTGHSGPIWQVAISPDGKQVATAGDDRTVALWDAETGKRLNRFRGHQGPVYAVAYAQATSGDGYRVVSAGADRRVLLWNTNEVRAVDYQAIGQRLTNQLDGQTPANPDRTAIKTPDYRLLGSHAGDVRSATFMRDDGFVVTSGHDNTVRVWNLADEGNSSAGAYRVLRGHGGWVRACSALGDATIISGGYDSTLKTWDYESYRERIDLLGHDDAISFATFSRDGTKVVTAARDRKAMVWDVATGQPLATLDEGHEFLTSSARFFGPGDDRLLTSAGDGTTIVWSLSTGAQVARYPGTGSNAVAALAPDKQWIATGSSTNEVLIWDVTQPSDNPQPQRLTGHAAMVTCAAFTVLDADLLLFTGDATGAGILWKRNAALETWQQDKVIAGHHNGFTIAAAQFTPDGKRLLTAGADHQVKQWDTATGRELPDSALEHADAVRLLELTPDGRSAVTVTAVDEKTQLLQVWNLATRAVKSLRLDYAVQGLSISPDGQFVAIGDTNPENTVWRWNLATGELTRFWPRGRLSATVWGLAWSPQGQQLLTVGGNHAHLWDVASGERVQTFSPHGPLVAADISTDGTLVVTAGQDGTAKVWHIDERRVVAKIAGGHLGGDGRPVALRGASFVANLAGRDYVLTTGEDNKACLWSLTEQVPERIKTFADDQHSIVQAVASLDGLRLLTGSDDGVAQVWDIATGERLRTLRDPDAHTLGLRCLSFSNDGRHAITGGDDNLAIVWNVSSGERLQKLQGHTAGITGVGFSPDGRRAITSSNDGTAKLWDVATGVEILTLSGHQSEVTAASFSPDGRLVLTAGRDRSALLWPAATLPPALAFTDQQLLYRERGIAQAIDEGASFSDPSAASFGGARLTIALRSEPINGLREEFSLSLAEPGEEMLRLEGNQILMAVGTAERAVPIAEWRSESSGRQAEIKFLPAANHHCVQTVLNRLRYTATWDSLDAPAARTLELIYVSATGESSPTLRMPIEFETTAASTTVAQLPAR